MPVFSGDEHMIVAPIENVYHARIQGCTGSHPIFMLTINPYFENHRMRNVKPGTPRYFSGYFRPKIPDSTTSVRHSFTPVFTGFEPILPFENYRMTNVRPRTPGGRPIYFHPKITYRFFNLPPHFTGFEPILPFENYRLKN